MFKPKSRSFDILAKVCGVIVVVWLVGMAACVVAAPAFIGYGLGHWGGLW